MTLTIGGLFSGIGGLELGLERAGMETRWQSEIHPFSSRVLAKHWPDIPNLGDITEIDWSTVEHVDVMCGGFPCQDISSANSTGGRPGVREGKKSSLWNHFHAGIAAIRPRWVVVENVTRGKPWLPYVRSDLHDIGYASLPIQVPAGSVGAPHRRPRIFLVAHPYGNSEPLSAIHAAVALLRPVPIRTGYWGEAEPSHVRVDDGIPHKMDRLRALGNAVVPQCAELVGRLIVEQENS